MTMYFAYGMNMDRDAMAARCPSARLINAGILPRHQFRINALGVATVVWTGNASDYVFGLIWELGPEDELAMDVFEGLGYAYCKDFVHVERQGGEVRSCMIYRAIESTPGVPREGYLENVIAAAEGHKFPKIYIERLRSWLK